MDVLTLTQIRLVAPGAFLFTLLGLLLGPFMPGMDGTPTQAGGEVFFLTALGAHLGTRLFAGELLGTQGSYLRALPIAHGRLFRLKLAVGLAAILLSGLIQAAVWTSGLASVWFNLVRDGAIYLAPEPGFFPLLLLWATLAFAASAYLAGAFEWVAAAIQAGILGWCSAAVLVVIPARLGLRSHGLEALLALAVSALLFGAAYRLQLRRGAQAASQKEAVLRDPRPHDAWLTVPAQLLVLAVPVSGLLLLWTLPGLDAWPIGSRFQKLGIVWLAIGIAFAPRSFRAISASGWGRARSLAAFLLALSGVGIFVLDALRPRGPVARCTGCGRRRTVSLGACPRCTAKGITAIEDGMRDGPRVPVTPAMWLTAAACVFAALVFVVGNRHLYLHAVEIVAKDPELDIVLDGNVVGKGVYRDLLVRRPPAPPADAEKHGFFAIWRRDDPVPGGETMGELAQGFEEHARQAQGITLCERHFDLRFAPDSILELRRGEQAGEIKQVTMGLRFRIARSNLRLQIEARFPDMERRAEDFMRDARLRGAAAAEDLTSDVLNDPFLRAALRYWPVRLLFEQDTTVRRIDLERTPVPEARTRADRAYARAVGRRFGLDGTRSVETARPIWEELAVKSEGLPLLAWRTFGRMELREHFHYLYPELRALSIVATTDELARRIESGSAHACLIAGLSQRSELFEACASLFERRGDGHWTGSQNSAFLRMDPVRLAAGWALLSIARERATTVLLNALHERPDPTVLELLSFTGSPLAAAETRTLAESTSVKLGRAFRIAPRAPIEKLRTRLLAVGIAVGWDLEPADYFEQAAGFEQGLDPR